MSSSSYKPPIQLQIACVKRELGMRRFVYPRRVMAGKMKPIESEREIRDMEAVLQTLERVANGEKLF